VHYGIEVFETINRSSETLATLRESVRSSSGRKCKSPHEQICSLASAGEEGFNPTVLVLVLVSLNAVQLLWCCQPHHSQTPILMRGPLNTSLPLLSTCSLQLGSSMMADWGHGRYMAAIWRQYDRDSQHITG
jgi:hypothetical protein